MCVTVTEIRGSQGAFVRNPFEETRRKKQKESDLIFKHECVGIRIPRKNNIT